MFGHDVMGHLKGRVWDLTCLLRTITSMSRRKEVERSYGLTSVGLVGRSFGDTNHKCIVGHLALVLAQKG